MRSLYTLAILLTLSLFLSCIENDIPYPIVKGDILEFEVAGQNSCEINAKDQTVVVEFYEGVDASKLEITKLKTYQNAIVMVPGFGRLKVGSVINLTSPLEVLVETYQTYKWTISLKLISRKQVSVDAWARRAYFKADKGSGDAWFEYSKADQESWLKVSSSADGDYVRGEVVGLEPETHYQARACFDGAYGNVVNFTTEGEAKIENMSFEEGYYEGKNYFPNASGGNSFWSTGNEGVTSTGKPSNTIGIEPGYIGKGMSLTSFEVSIVGHAAGNLYTGTFKLNFLNPKSSVKFGREYSGRPSKLKGFYKYKSTTITKGSGDMIGKPDTGHIWISLENWGGAKSRPTGVTYGFDAAKTVIGFGDLTLDADVDAYKEFTIDIKYIDEAIKNGIKPTHIVLVATSSKYGADYIGGVGSNLCIDELVFEF